MYMLYRIVVLSWRVGTKYQFGIVLLYDPVIQMLSTTHLHDTHILLHVVETRFVWAFWNWLVIPYTIFLTSKAVNTGWWELVTQKSLFTVTQALLSIYCIIVLHNRVIQMLSNTYLYDVDIFMHILETCRFDLMIEP